MLAPTVLVIDGESQVWRVARHAPAADGARAAPTTPSPACSVLRGGGRAAGPAVDFQPDNRLEAARAESRQSAAFGERDCLGLVAFSGEALTQVPLTSGHAFAHAAVEGLVAPQARAKGLALAAAACPAALAARADPEKLRQVLVNLLSNPVKFTEAGGRISVACAADGGRVRIAVSDTGVGIAPEQLERVFEPFVQVRADLTRTAEGTGLGLAISRDLARGMGGELTVESTLGAGSTFTLTLPGA